MTKRKPSLGFTWGLKRRKLFLLNFQEKFSVFKMFNVVSITDGKRAPFLGLWCCGSARLPGLRDPFQRSWQPAINKKQNVKCLHAAPAANFYEFNGLWYHFLFGTGINYSFFHTNFKNIRRTSSDDETFRQPPRYRRRTAKLKTYLKLNYVLWNQA